MDNSQFTGFLDDDFEDQEPIMMRTGDDLLSDSAFQEPDMASSYEGDEDAPPLSRYLSFSSVSSKDKRKLLDEN